MLSQPAGVLEQHNLVVFEAVNVKGPQELAQPPWHRKQSLRKKKKTQNHREEMIFCTASDHRYHIRIVSV